MSENTNIIDVTETEFNDQVIEASANKLIVVDFWAPWCGPCKQLTPILEKIISKSVDKITLVKINIDENQQIAAQLRIQSIPTVYAFKDKQIVNAFQGVIPEVQIIEEVEIIDIAPETFSDQKSVPLPPEEVTTPPTVTTSIMEIKGRIAEIDALCRDFLVVGKIDDREDVEAFLASLTNYGFEIDGQDVVDFVNGRLLYLDEMAKQERDAIHTMPNSWREREALRKFEDARSRLREVLPEIISSNDGEMVKARMAFEEAARGMQLDLRLPSVSGRLHALFDLQVSLDEELSASNPKNARRTRVIRLLQHGAIHLNPNDRRTLDRLERNIEGFEQLVETILEKSEGVFGEPQQALVIRFLDKKGYEVNNADLRPRVVAAAGVIGAELGHISPSEIPRLAPGIKVSDTEVDSIITDLKRLAKQFKSNDEEVIEEESELAESVADAADRVNSMRAKIDGVDDLLARLKLSHD